MEEKEKESAKEQAHALQQELTELTPLATPSAELLKSH